DPGEFRDPETGEVRLHEGDEIEATVVDDGSRSGSIVLKRVAGRGGHVPGELEQAFAHGVAIEGLVTGENKGGYDVQIGSMRAFCPGSQIDRRRTEGAQYVGQRFRFRITKLEAGGRNVVVSRRQLLDEEAADRARAVWAELRVGAVVGGTVSSAPSWSSPPVSTASCTSPGWRSTAGCRMRGRSCRSATPSTSRSWSSTSRSGASASRWSSAPGRRRRRARRTKGAIPTRCSSSRAGRRPSGRSGTSSRRRRSRSAEAAPRRLSPAKSCIDPACASGSMRARKTVPWPTFGG